MFGRQKRALQIDADAGAPVIQCYIFDQCGRPGNARIGTEHIHLPHLCDDLRHRGLIHGVRLAALPCLRQGSQCAVVHVRHPDLMASRLEGLSHGAPDT